MNIVKNNLYLASLLGLACLASGALQAAGVGPAASDDKKQAEVKEEVALEVRVAPAPAKKWRGTPFQMAQAGRLYIDARPSAGYEMPSNDNLGEPGSGRRYEFID